MNNYVLQKSSDFTALLYPIHLQNLRIVLLSNLVGTRYCGDFRFLLSFHRDVGRLRIEIEVTQLCDIFYQHHNDVVTITQCNVKLRVIVTSIFNVILISDKDENASLFHLSKYSDILYGNIVCKMQPEISNLYFTCIYNQLHLYLPQFINLLFFLYDLSQVTCRVKTNTT